MNNATEQDNNTILIGIGKHLKVIAEQQTIIAEQQKQQTDCLKSIASAMTFLTIAVVLIAVVLFLENGIL